MKLNPLSWFIGNELECKKADNEAKKLEIENRKLELLSKRMRQNEEHQAEMAAQEAQRLTYTAPTLPEGVVPGNKKAPIAMDSCANLFDYASGYDPNFFPSFLGYPQMAALSQSSDYRSVIETTSTEMTRAWGRFIQANTDDMESDGSESDVKRSIKQEMQDRIHKDRQQRISALEEEFTRLDIQGLVRHAIEVEQTFGRAQIHVDLDHGKDKESIPLPISEKNIPKGTKPRFSVIEPMWSTPSVYNANNPTDPDFFKPSKWYVMGREVHADRMYTLIMRPVADILKPAYNFGGLSMVQLMKPYVQRFQRTADSVSELVHSYSLTILSTDMSDILTEGVNDSSLSYRAGMFNKHKSNDGLMLLDKESEQIEQINTPLTGIPDLYRQSQEMMAAPSHTPLVKLLGLTPSGLNASSDGEIRVYYDYIMAQNEAHVRPVISWISKIVQLSLFGDIDEGIEWEFNPLYQLSDQEIAEINRNRSETLGNLVNNYLIDAEEARRVLSGYEYSDFGFINAGDAPEMPESDSFDIGGLLS